MALLFGVGRWYAAHGMARMRAQTPRHRERTLSRGRVAGALAILVALMLSKFVYTASVTSYYTFYLIERFEVSVRSAQLYLFVYLAAVAIGTVAGGALGDRFGRKFVIWFSILGVMPFTLALPYANLFWTGVLTVPIGLILASAFPAIVVYGQELVPFRVGTVAGLFFGFAFGLGGIGAALLGQIADVTGVRFVFQLCSFLPAIGLLAAFLPRTARRAAAAGEGVRRGEPGRDRRFRRLYICDARSVASARSVLDITEARAHFGLFSRGDGGTSGTDSRACARAAEPSW